MIVRRAFLVLLVICLGCSAQSPPSSSSGPVSAVPSDITKVVERHVRAQYSLPPDVQVKVGTPRSSEFPNYDALTVTFASPGQKKDFEFLLSHDHKTLLRVTRFDLTRDPYTEMMKKIDVSGRPTRGNKDAKVTVVNYDDFECPFCARMHQTLFPGLFKEYGTATSMRSPKKKATRARMRNSTSSPLYRLRSIISTFQNCRHA